MTGRLSKTRTAEAAPRHVPSAGHLVRDPAFSLRLAWDTAPAPRAAVKSVTYLTPNIERVCPFGLEPV